MEAERGFVPMPDLQCHSFGPELIAPSPPIINHLTLAGNDDRMIPGDEGTIPLPFPLDISIPIPQYETKEQVHRDYCSGKLGKLRINLVKEILKPPITTLDTVAKRYEFLAQKGRTLREVTSEMTLEFKYPKVSVEILGKVKGKLEKSSESAAVRTPPAISFSRANTSGHSETGNKVEKEGADGIRNQKEQNNNEELERRLKHIFDEITPIPELSRKSATDFWQFRAEKSLEPREKGSAKRFWKRNSYPPKTFQEKILELRKKDGVESLGTDLLPGIWIPEFMIPEFEVTGITYDPNNRKGLKIEPPLDWYTLYAVREKCLNWLTKNQKFL